jgi:hypothetical protein
LDEIESNEPKIFQNGVIHLIKDVINSLFRWSMTSQRLAPAFPESKWLLIPTVMALLSFNIVLICENILRFGSLFGLLLDVIGASILAIPDVPLLWRRTYSGRLQYAKDSLNGNGIGGFSVLHRPGISFHSHHNYTGFLQLIDALEPIMEEGLSELAHSTYFINSNLDLSDIDTVSKTQSADIALFNNSRDNHRNGYAGWSSGVMEPDSSQFFVPINMVNKRLRSRIEKQKSRIRRTGLSLLILGFLQQILFSYI